VKELGERERAPARDRQVASMRMGITSFRYLIYLYISDIEAIVKQIMNANLLRGTGRINLWNSGRVPDGKYRVTEFLGIGGSGHSGQNPPVFGHHLRLRGRVELRMS